jgi:hypothetical protein
MTTALIAFRQLKPAVQKKVIALLKKHPHYAAYLTKDMPAELKKEKDRNAYVFMRAATWSDWVRDEKNPMVKKEFDRPTWHYINLPFVPAAKQGKVKPRPGHGDNIVTLLAKCMAVLQDPRARDKDRAVMLCWLFHLVGDIHQPLHCATLYTRSYPEKAGDQGGNIFLVQSRGRTLKLHYLWDSLLGTADAFEAVRFLTADLLDSPRYRRRKLPELKKTGFDAWARESHALARAITYQNGLLKGRAISGKETLAEIAKLKAPMLPTSYEAVARAVARRRIALAGYRLADRLTEVFGKE